MATNSQVTESLQNARMHPGFWSRPLRCRRAEQDRASSEDSHHDAVATISQNLGEAWCVAAGGDQRSPCGQAKSECQLAMEKCYNPQTTASVAMRSDYTIGLEIYARHGRVHSHALISVPPSLARPGLF